MHLKTLGKYVLQHPRVEKKVLFSWMQQILAQLQAMEQIKIIPDTITPFQVVIQENRTVILADLEKVENTSYSVLEKFFPDQGQNSSIYSFGKTLQFLLAKAELTPKMTWREELHFRSIISKCLTNKSKKQYRKFSEIKLSFSRRKKYIIGIALILSLVLVHIGTYDVEQETIIKEKEQEYFELGVSYFLLHKNYEKSEELFEKVESKRIGEYFREISSYMAGTSQYTDLEMEIILNEAIKLSDVQEGVEERVCLLWAYEKVDTPNARKQVKNLAEDVLDELLWNEVKKEVRGILANIYLREGEYANALREYRVLLTESEYEEISKTIENIKKKTQ